MDASDVISIIALAIAAAAFLLGERRERNRDKRDEQRFGIEQRRDARDAAASMPNLDVVPPSGHEPDGAMTTLVRVTVHNLGSVAARNAQVTLTVGEKRTLIAQSEQRTLGINGMGDVFHLQIPNAAIEHKQGEWLTFKGGAPLITATCDEGSIATWPRTAG